MREGLSKDGKVNSCFEYSYHTYSLLCSFLRLPSNPISVKKRYPKPLDTNQNFYKLDILVKICENLYERYM